MGNYLLPNTMFKNYLQEIVKFISRVFYGHFQEKNKIVRLLSNTPRFPKRLQKRKRKATLYESVASIVMYVINKSIPKNSLNPKKVTK